MATKASSTARTGRKPAAKTVSNNVETTVQNTEAPQAPTIREQKIAYKPKEVELDPHMYVPVRNGFNGKLIYISRKTGERYVWENFGDEQDMELMELRAAKTSYKAFFENNWFLIDDPDVIEYLGVERFYKDALTYDEFDTLFEMDPDAIESKVSGLSKGQKMSLKYRARQMVKDGRIDSIKVITILERLLETELINRQGDIV